jgi:hypothetical protein
VQNIQGEIERAFTRMDITTNLARTFSATITPTIERQVKESLGQSLLPNLQAQAAKHQQELLQHVHAEMDAFKNNVATMQNETLRNQEVCLDAFSLYDPWIDLVRRARFGISSRSCASSATRSSSSA